MQHLQTPQRHGQHSGHESSGPAQPRSGGGWGRTAWFVLLLMGASANSKKLMFSGGGRRQDTPQMQSVTSSFPQPRLHNTLIFLFGFLSLQKQSQQRSC